MKMERSHSNIWRRGHNRSLHFKVIVSSDLKHLTRYALSERCGGRTNTPEIKFLLLSLLNMHQSDLMSVSHSQANRNWNLQRHPLSWLGFLVGCLCFILLIISSRVMFTLPSCLCLFPCPFLCIYVCFLPLLYHVISISCVPMCPLCPHFAFLFVLSFVFLFTFCLGLSFACLLFACIMDFWNLDASLWLKFPFCSFNFLPSVGLVFCNKYTTEVRDSLIQTQWNVALIATEMSFYVIDLLWNVQRSAVWADRRLMMSHLPSSNTTSIHIMSFFLSASSPIRD